MEEGFNTLLLLPNLKWRGKLMKQKLSELFNLEWIQKFVEENIDHTDWIEEDCRKETTK